jgi:hypothetical protein
MMRNFANTGTGGFDTTPLLAGTRRRTVLVHTAYVYFM